MEKKYKLDTDDIIEVENKILYRIIYQKDIPIYYVKKGDKGGYVESEKNLSQENNCVILDDAHVYGNAVICDNSLIYGNSLIYDNSLIYGNSLIYENARVYGDAQVFNDAQVFDNAKVFDNARICGNVVIYNNAVIYDNAQVYGNAQISNDVRVFGNAQIQGDAIVENERDYIVFKNWWSSGRYFTWTRSNDKYTVGCFHGSGDELIKNAYKDSELSGKEYERIVNYVNDIKNSTYD